MGNDPARKIYFKEFKAITHAMLNYEDLNLLIKHLAELICREFEVKGCAIMLLDEHENRLVHVASYCMCCASRPPVKNFWGPTT